MSELPERTALYRFYDAQGELLYLGITYHPDDRWKEHQYWTEWHVLVGRRTLEWFASRKAALKAEEAAIRAEKPRHNTAHNFDIAPPPSPEWPSLAHVQRTKGAKLAELMRTEITEGRWLPGQRLPPREVLARAAGVGEGAVDRAIKILDRENVLRVIRGTGTFISRI